VKSVYYEKAHDFVQSTKSSLPVIGVDLPVHILSHMALETGWITDDEAWKPILADKAVSDRKYAETVREGVRKLVKEDEQGSFWLFGVREARVRD
jgi:translation initiation factor 2-alpha kinase 4